MPNIGKIIRVNELPPIGERERNVIYQVAEVGSAVYTDYAIDETGDLKTHAVVEGTIPLELADNHISISNQELVAEGLSSQAEYNISTKEKLNKKLDVPSEEGEVQDYPKIIGLDDHGNIAKLPAGDLGKNIANSSLISVAGAGLTLGANWQLNTSGLNYSITGLSDVSNDSTFNTFLSQNSAGKIGKTNGKKPFISLPSTLTEAERTAWKTAMNGGWTTNTMSIALINPIVVQKIDAIQYVTLLGANLNMNPTNFSVEIMDNAGINVIATIPGSQVQLQNDGLSLIFYYNFKDLSVGNYKVRLWNGVAYYVSPTHFQILANADVFQVDKSLITWTFDYITKADGGSYNDYLASNGSIRLGAKVLNSSGGTYGNGNRTTVASALSSELIANGIPITFNDNFYIELEFSGNYAASEHYGGISQENTVSMLENFIASTRYFYGDWWRLLPSNNQLSNRANIPTKLIISKTGNLITLVMSSNFGSRITSFSFSSSSSPVRLKLNKFLFENAPTYQTTMNLITAYKF